MGNGRYTIRRVDNNQPEIVDLLRRLGFSVAILSNAGHGIPDLGLAKKGITMLAEIKDGQKAKSQRQLTRDQVVFHQEWHAEIPIIETTDDVLKLNARFAAMTKP